MDRGVAAWVVSVVHSVFMTAVALAFMAIAVVFFVGAWVLRINIISIRKGGNEEE